MHTSVSHEQDEQLVHGAREGNAAAFDEIARRHYGVVYAVGLARLGQRDHAEDLAQEVFLRAYLLLDRLDQPSLISHWLTRMARNLAVDWQRRGSRATRLAHMVPIDQLPPAIADTKATDAREKASAAEREQALHAALASLTPELREMVLLHYMEGLSHGDIADRFGLERSTVSRHITRALGSMRGLIETAVRETAAGLSASPAARARTLSLGAALVSLPAATKSALAAAALQSTPAAALVATGSSGAPATGFAGLLHTLFPALSAGGTYMGYTKAGISLAAVAVIGAGGYYLATAKTEMGTSPSVSVSRPIDNVTAAPAGQAKLHFALPVGQRVVYRLDAQMNNTNEYPSQFTAGANQPKAVNVRQLRDLAISTTKQHPDGSSTIEIETIGAQLDTALDSSQQSFRSGTFATGGSPGGNALDVLIGHVVTARVTPRGVMDDFKGLRPVDAGILAAMPAKLRQNTVNLMSEDTMRVIYSSILAPSGHSGSVLKPGDTWDTSRKGTDAEKYTITQKHKFNGWKLIDGKQLIEITSHGTEPPSPSDIGGPGAGQITYDSVAADTTTYIDPSLGIVDQSVAHLQIGISIKFLSGANTPPVILKVNSNKTKTLTRQKTG